MLADGSVRQFDLCAAEELLAAKRAVLAAQADEALHEGVHAVGRAVLVQDQALHELEAAVEELPDLC